MSTGYFTQRAIILLGLISVTMSKINFSTTKTSTEKNNATAALLDLKELIQKQYGHLRSGNLHKNEPVHLLEKVFDALGTFDQDRHIVLAFEREEVITYETVEHYFYISLTEAEEFIEHQLAA